jgi:hypothetical protein
MNPFTVNSYGFSLKMVTGPARMTELGFGPFQKKIGFFGILYVGDTIKELMSSPKCKNIEVINNSARPVLNHREVNSIIKLQIKK